MRKLLIPAALCLLAACGDEVNPRQWAAMEEACLSHGGIMYSMNAGIWRHADGAGFAGLTVHCRNGATIVFHMSNPDK